jgi:hypothetical protein
MLDHQGLLLLLQCSEVSHQIMSERRQRGATAAACLGRDDGLGEQAVQLIDQQPRVAIGHAGGTASSRDRPHDPVSLDTGLLATSPSGPAAVVLKTAPGRTDCVAVPARVLVLHGGTGTESLCHVWSQGCCMAVCWCWQHPVAAWPMSPSRPRSRRAIFRWCRNAQTVPWNAGSRFLHLARATTPASRQRRA